MLQGTLVGELFKKFLDLLLPSPEVNSIRSKQQLGKYLLKLISIVDSYSFECERIKNLLESGMSNSDPIKFDRRSSESVTRLSRLANEFAEIIREIEYLKVFDSELIRSFHSSMTFELGNPLLGYVGLLDEAECLDASYDAKSKTFTLSFAATYYGTPAPGPEQLLRNYSLSNSDDINDLINTLNNVQKTIKESLIMASKFLREHFTPDELFPIRDELS